LPIPLDKAKGRRKVKNVFVNDDGFLDISNDLNMLLHNINGGPVLRELKHPLPNPDDPADLLFLFAYDKAQHGKQLRNQLDLYHLDLALHDQIYALVIKYWSAFDERGVFIPVRNYKCVIDTRQRRSHCCEEDLLWTERNSDHAPGHIGTSKNGPYLTDPRWPMALQDHPHPQAPPGTRPSH
jgi:hypothetical protein